MKLNFDYVNKNGKTVRGAAALTHHIYTNEGGVDNFVYKISSIAVNEFVRNLSPAIQREIQKDITRSKLKVV